VSTVTQPEPAPSEPRPVTTYTYGSGTTSVANSGATNSSGYTRRVGFDAKLRQTTATDRLGNVTTQTWNPSTAVDVIDRIDSPQGTRIGFEYDAKWRPTVTWGPDNASAFTGAVGGANSPRSEASYDEGLNGLAVAYWPTADFSGPPTLRTTEPLAAKYFNAGVPNANGLTLTNVNGTTASADNWSVRYSGSIALTTTGTYTFRPYHHGGVRLFVNGKLVIDAWNAAETWTSTLATYVSSTPNAVVPIEMHYRDRGGDGNVDLHWIKPGGTLERVPSARFTPDYGLVTSVSKRTTSASVASTTQTEYQYPHLGLPTATVVDSGGAALRTETSYESLGSGYIRRTSMRLPTGASSQVGYEYYGNTETALSNTCGVTGSQFGLLKRITQADPDGAGPETALVREYVYDQAGRRRGSRASTNLSSEPWTCSSYDSRGRVSSVAHPAGGGEPARTVSYDYAVGGDPLRVTTTDTTGTITTELDLLGRAIGYTDVWGKSSTTTYGSAGQVAQKVTAGGTITYTYDGSSGLLEEVSLDGDVIAEVDHDVYGRPQAAVYPNGSGNAGNGTEGTFTYDTRGLPASSTWTNSGTSALITSDEVTTRDLIGRVTDYRTDGVDPYPAGQNYEYDGAGRLTRTRLFDTGVGSGTRTIEYGFGGTTSCTQNTAGKNSNRTTQTITPAVGTPATLSYCYDHADRITSTTDPATAAFTYDNHGNTATIGSESRVHDGSDRHVETASSSVTVRYVRDALDRIVERRVNGTAVARYSYTDSRDVSVLTLTSGGTVAEVTVSLPGGALWTRRSGGNVWSYPNLRGDIVATANQAGVKVGGTGVYDSFGSPVAGPVPDNSAGAFDYAWHGGQQRGLEHETGLLPTVAMGTREYMPRLGRFLQVDPVEGGAPNDYSYATDPISQADLDGRVVVGLCGSLAFVPGFGTDLTGCVGFDHTDSERLGVWGSAAISLGLDLGGQVGLYFSSAERLEDLRGQSTCISVSGGPEVSIGVSFCWWNVRGNVTFSVFTSIGLGPLPVGGNFTLGNSDMPNKTGVKIFSGWLASWIRRAMPFHLPRRR
jgi:RHS repeat-associated protein